MLRRLSNVRIKNFGYFDEMADILASVSKEDFKTVLKPCKGHEIFTLIGPAENTTKLLEKEGIISGTITQSAGEHGLHRSNRNCCHQAYRSCSTGSRVQEADAERACKKAIKNCPPWRGRPDIRTFLVIVVGLQIWSLLVGRTIVDLHRLEPHTAGSPPLTQLTSPWRADLNLYMNVWDGRKSENLPQH